MDGRKTGRRTKSVMKTIGIVAEGPRDFELIAAVIDTITNEENSYQMFCGVQTTLCSSFVVLIKWNTGRIDITYTSSFTKE